MDGVILSPSRPAVSIDSWFVQQAFGANGPKGDLWTTYTAIANRRWDHIFGAGLQSAFTLTTSMLNLDCPGARSIPNALAYALPVNLDTSNVTLLTFNDKTSIQIPACQYTNFQLFHVAPIEMNGWAILGELNKWVPVAAARLKSVTVQSNSVSVLLAGYPTESVTYSFVLSPTGAPAAIQEFTCKIPSSGEVTLTVPAGTCTTV
jgi:hypothetical protein